MNSVVSIRSGMRAATQALSQANWAQRTGMLALFALPALVVTTPANLLPFGMLLLASSLLGAGMLWRCRPARPVMLGLLTLTVVPIGLGALSLWQSSVDVRELDNLTRLLVVPWTACWVYALGLSQRPLWSGAVAGLFAAVLMAAWQVAAGAERADGWTNAIVLADVAVVLLVLVISCRPPRRLMTVLLAVLATALLVVLSGSRGVWPALLLLLLLAVLGGERRAWGRRLLLLALAGVMACGVLLLSPGLREQVRLNELQQDVQRLQQGDVNSSAGARYERLQVAWEAFSADPWQGVGIGQFDVAMQRLPVCRSQHDSPGRCHLAHAHNDLAEWAATRGVPGIIALLMVYGLPLLLFVQLWRRGGRPLHGPEVAGVGVVLVYVVCGLTQSMFAHQITAGLYACLVGILVGLSLNRQRSALAQVATG